MIDFEKIDGVLKELDEIQASLREMALDPVFKNTKFNNLNVFYVPTQREQDEHKKSLVYNEDGEIDTLKSPFEPDFLYKNLTKYRVGCTPEEYMEQRIDYSNNGHVEPIIRLSTSKRKII